MTDLKEMDGFFDRHASHRDKKLNRRKADRTMRGPRGWQEQQKATVKRGREATRKLKEWRDE